jgi:predicted amidophosphoribosyltransferase
MADFFIRSDGLKIYYIPEPYCELCNLPIPQKYADWGRCAPCNKKFGHGEPDIRVRAVSRYLHPSEYPDDLFSQEIIRFKTDPDLAHLLGECMVTAITDRFPELLEADIIIPVQKSKPNKFHRTAFLADYVSKKLEIPWIDALVAADGYQPVHEVSVPQKAGAIQGKVLCTHSFNGETILLIDDTYIEGTTKRECARVLKSHGAGKICGLVLGRAVAAKHIRLVKQQNESEG